VPARAGYQRLDANAALETRGVPVVAIAGSCMEAGKTAAACAVIGRMRHRGLTVDAFKATGVSLRRDILAMEDAGARRCAIFTDLGVVTTTRANGPALTRTMLSELAAEFLADLRRLDAAFFTMNGVISVAFFIFLAADLLTRK